jgi:6-phosphogluconolactonase (cycloisomerase 2 family)
MLKSITQSVWSLVLLAFLPTGLAAQRYIYTNNDIATQNYISGYSVASDGTASAVPGSPFLTGPGQQGSGGGYYAANRIIIVNNFLYASNSGSNTVSAFSIDPGTGTLTPVSGSPFPTDAFNDPAAGSGISLAATPDGKYLFAGSTGLGGQITMYNIDASGALTLVKKSPVPSGGAMSSIKVSPDGNYLLVAIPSAGEISVFAVRGPGMLHSIHNSPYVLSSEAATSVDINCAGNLVYGGGTAGDIYAFNFASGALSPVAGSPFATGLASNNVVALSKDDSTLFSSNQDGSTVTAFAVGLTGGLTVPGASVSAVPPGTTGFLPYPAGLAVGDDGLFLYAADVNGSASQQSGFSVFGLAGTPALVLDTFSPIDLSSVSTSSTAGLRSLAAYPAKACTAGAASSAHTPQE